MLTLRKIARHPDGRPRDRHAMIGRGQLAHFRANNATRVGRSAPERLLRGRSGLPLIGRAQRPPAATARPISSSTSPSGSTRPDLPDMVERIDAIAVLGERRTREGARMLNANEHPQVPRGPDMQVDQQTDQALIDSMRVGRAVLWPGDFKP